MTSADSARASVAGVPRHKLRAMLRAVTEYLAATLAGSADRTPGWNEAEWRIAQAVAIIHGISPLLAQRTEWSRAPAEWHAFLAGQRAHSIARHRRIEAALATVRGPAELQSIPFVPLKGAALHSLGLYRPGDRPMADIDLLLAPHHLQPMCAALSALGYRLVSSSAAVQVLVPADRPAQVHLGEHAENGATIELHAAVRHAMPVREVDITSRLWPAAPRPGPNGYPSKAALMTHLVHHAAVNIQLRILRMVQLHDMALLAQHLSAADWQELVATGGDDDNWWAVPPLMLLARYYPGAVPGDVIGALSTRCPRALAFMAPRLLLSDVSASNPRRPVFPALLWSGSCAEAVTTVFGRARSGVRALGRGNKLPLAGELQPWITRSHRRRALDVLLGRARPETMMMISAALAGDFAPTGSQRQPNAA